MEILAPFKEQAEAFRVVNMQIWRDSALVERLDLDEEIRRNQYSASKSFTAAAVGLAVKEGLLSLDEKVADCFPEELPPAPNVHLLAATVRDLLTMCAGQDHGVLMGVDRIHIADKNWARYALAQPFPLVPGSKFVYNNTGPYLAGLLVQCRAGCDLVRYLMPRLFEPLGIRLPTWEMDPMGNTFGAGGLFLTVTEMAKFTLLHLQEGRWEGRQILTPEWVREATGKRVDSDRDPHGYGYLFWRGPSGTYRCDGKYGQYSIAVPAKKAVIAVNSECRRQGELLDAIYQEVIRKL